MAESTKSAPHTEASEDEERSLLLPVILAVLFAGGASWALYRHYSQEEDQGTSRVNEAAAPGQSSENRGEPVEVRFRESARESGILFVHNNGSDGRKLLPETMGAGAVFFDADNDGDQDLFLVNSAPWDEAARSAAGTQTYYENEDGKFTDRTRESGLGLCFYGMGAAAGDFDNDGFQDLYVTAVGSNRLFRNVDGRRFVEVTEAAGVGGGDTWSTGAAFLDYDGDGDLDLAVLNYVHWTAEIDLGQSFSLGSLKRAFGPPTSFSGAQPFLFRNRGDGTFEDAAREAGFHVSNKDTGVPVGKSLGLLVTDFDNNHLPDIVVANDTVRNFAFKNLGGGKFEEVGLEMGLAFDENGNARGAMGIDDSCYRNDGAAAIAIGNFANEMTAFYVLHDPELPPFMDEATSVGIGAPSRDSLSFGLVFHDCDLDGLEDLAVANGHVEPDIARVQASQSHAQPVDVFLNRNGRFVRSKSPVLARRMVGRGLAVADVDGDGDLDMLVTANGGAPRLFLNELENGRSLRLDLRLGNGSRALGAEVTAVTTAGKQMRRLYGGGSYLCESEKIITLGLGGGETAQEVTIRWPDGTVQELGTLKAGVHRLVQP